MTWNKVLQNPKQRVQELPLPTARGRVVSAVANVDRHLSEAQAVLSKALGESWEEQAAHGEIWRELENLRWRLRKRWRL